MTKAIERTEARRLRAAGTAIKVIARQLHVSPGSVHAWCKDLHPTPEQKVSIEINATPQQSAGLKKATAAKIAKARASAQHNFDQGARTIGDLTDRDLMMIGLGLYWGEGSKRAVGAVSVANMDPRVHAVFLRWIDLLGMRRETVTAKLTISEEANVPFEQDWWANRLQLPPGCFRKAVTRLSPTSKRKRIRENYHGILTLTCFHTPTWHCIMGMVSRAGFEPSVTAVRGRRPEPLNERDLKI